MAYPRATRDSRVVLTPVLSHDPSLADFLPASEVEEAERVLVAPAVTLEPGPWAPRSGIDPRAGHLGLLIASGSMIRQVELGPTVCAELVGPGDLLRPWASAGVGSLVAAQTSWEVLEEARILLLDRRFAVAAARWPDLTGALVERAINRAHALALAQAIGCTTGLELRLLTLFRQLAHRWGRMRPDGVLVPLRLTHETIARLVGARRPSVSSTLKQLERDGRLTRIDRDTWLLALASPESNGRAPVMALAA